MYVISSFEHSLKLELAIKQIEGKGINRQQIFVAPLKPNLRQHKLYDTINRNDGISLLDAAAIFGAIFSVLGVIYGFVLPWGPIVWGLIGLAFGVVLGLILDLIVNKKRRQKKSLDLNRYTEVILIINCEREQVDFIEAILRENYAIGIAVIKRD